MRAFLREGGGVAFCGDIEHHKTRCKVVYDRTDAGDIFFILTFDYSIFFSVPQSFKHIKRKATTHITSPVTCVCVLCSLLRCAAGLTQARLLSVVAPLAICLDPSWKL